MTNRSTEAGAWRRLAGPQPFFWTLGITATATAIGFLLMPPLGQIDLIMIYMIGVVVISTRFGSGASVVAAALSVAAFDYFFVPPTFAFAVTDSKYLITFGVMFVVAAVTGELTNRVRRQREQAQVEERRASVLYALSRELAAASREADLYRIAERQLHELFDCEVMCFPMDSRGALVQGHEQGGDARLSEADAAAAQRLWDDAATTESETPSAAGTRLLLVRLHGSHGVVGMLGLRSPPSAPRFRTAEQRNLLQTSAHVIASAIERARMAEHAQQAQVRLEAERFRNALLSSVSHDLRTPLAAIEGAATTMLQKEGRLGAPERDELTQMIVDEAGRLGRLVRNLLDMTRLETQPLGPATELQPIEEVIGGALARTEQRLRQRTVRMSVPDDLPLVAIDGVLIEQVIINLLDNALRHTPATCALELAAKLVDRSVVVTVADHGPGLAPGTEERVFEKFYRGSGPASSAGAGLGLAICRAILDAHGGRIWAENCPGGGAAFHFALPFPPQPSWTDDAAALEA